MPNWEGYYFNYDTGTSIQQEYEEFVRDCERQDRRYEQMMREAEEQCYQEMKQAEELREDKRKYPLFFLKDGIV